MTATQTAAVRLPPQQVDIIRAAVADIFGSDAGVWLFGSRVDPDQRGGDIDLYVETSCDPTTALQHAGRLYSRLQRELGEQRIDIVTRSPGEPEQAIHRVARETGVRL
jgi:predicted nucleotidyltransferase